MNVLTAKGELQAMLHGTTLSQVENITGVFNRAARQLMLDIDPQETKRIAQLDSPVFYQVFDYNPPVDLKGQKIIDLFPQVNRYPGDFYGQTYNQNFDLNKLTTLVEGFTVVSDTGVKTLRINFLDSSKSININTISDITANGTWATSGTASNLLVNTGTIINGSPVLQFDVAAGTGYLTNSTMTSVDLSNFANLASIFFLFFANPPASITSLSLRFGSDDANYYENTSITTNYQGNALVQGFNQEGVAWSDLTTVGSPDPSNITYVRIGVTVSADCFGLQLAQLTAKLGTILNCEYYSKYLFSNAAGTIWKETTDSDTDLINLDTESFNLYMYQLASLCVQQALGQDAGYDTNIFRDLYYSGLARYKRMYKSEITKPQQMYYTRTNSRYDQFFGGNMWNNN